MKNFKVVLSLLPIIALGCFVYFSSIGFSKFNVKKTSPPDSKIEKITKEKTSSTVMLWITLSGAECLSGNYSYCINGGNSYYVNTEGFYAEVPCGEEFTICVRTLDISCRGSYTGTVSCDTDTYKIVELSPFNTCDCN
ncbi:MAG: hypothetical protein K1X86_12115 [Ignavibacteria bacterium]|nr:hypothetical protein [Ignavibacteria bacterium]